MGSDRPLRKSRGGSVDKAWEDTVRLKIQNSKIVNRLISYVIGEITLEPAQVTAGLGLLKKALPDLTTIDATITGEVTNYVLSDKPMSEDEWETAYGVESTAGAAKSAH